MAVKDGGDHEVHGATNAPSGMHLTAYGNRTANGSERKKGSERGSNLHLVGPKVIRIRGPTPSIGAWVNVRGVYCSGAFVQPQLLRLLEPDVRTDPAPM